MNNKYIYMTLLTITSMAYAAEPITERNENQKKLFEDAFKEGDYDRARSLYEAKTVQMSDVEKQQYIQELDKNIKDVQALAAKTKVGKFAQTVQKIQTKIPWQVKVALEDAAKKTAMFGTNVIFLAFLKDPKVYNAMREKLKDNTDIVDMLQLIHDTPLDNLDAINIPLRTFSGLTANLISYIRKEMPALSSLVQQSVNKNAQEKKEAAERLRAALQQ